VIIKNHPNSAKAFYAMAQAQAGLGNQEKAQKALNIATGLNPALDFAPEGSVQKLKQAITPQVAKIESIEESHTMRNTILVMFVLALGFVAYTVYRRNKEADEKYEAEMAAAEAKARAEREAQRKQEHMERLAKMDAERKAELAAAAALKAHKNYGNERFDPTNPDVLLPKKTKAQLKEEAELREAQAKADLLEATARNERYRQQQDNARYNSVATPAPTVTHVHQNSGNDMLTGILVGNMLSGSHHDTTRVVEREVIREVPAAPSRSSSWDDTPSTPSRSSSWDDTPSSSSRSSSWSDSSSSSSSSSWSDSSSSSSDSGSSSSWD
jgi:uncharacterized membrane protein YgcG